MQQPEGCRRERSYAREALPGEARQGSPASCSGGSGAGGARERSGEEEAAEGRGRLLVFGAGGGSHSCRCTSGRHFVLRGSERDTHRILPPPPPRPSLPLPPRSVPTHRAQAAPPRPPALALSEGAAAAAAPWQRCPSATLLSLRLGARLGTGSARRGPARVDVVKQARGEGICLGRTPPGSTCSLH